MYNFDNYPIFTATNNDIKAYIISLTNNELSQKLTKRCIESLNNVNMSYQIWDAIDGTDGQNLVFPEHLKNKEYFCWLKKANERITTSEIALFLTHFSLWVHCCNVNEPIVILEHDAIMVKKYEYHKFVNSIYYLGHEMQMNANSIHTIWHFIHNSYYFMPYTHAYAIDPPAARNLISHAIKFGLISPVDNFMRMDVFSIVQDDFYAYQKQEGSTIQHS
jgi:glycosyl transferase family 25